MSRWLLPIALALSLVALASSLLGRPDKPDTFVILGGGPPSLELYVDGKYVGGVALNGALPNFTMYDGFLWGGRLVVTTPEVGRWIYIYELGDLSRPSAIIEAPGNVSHFLYYSPDVAPVEGGVLWLAVSDFGDRKGYLCPLDLYNEVLGKCVPVGLYPHAPIYLNGDVVAPLMREPYLVVMVGGRSLRVPVLAFWPPYVNSHEALRYVFLSFHMLTTDGVYIYGEGHPIEPGYRLSPVDIDAMSLLVEMNSRGQVLAYFPTSAPPPGLPGLAVCRGKLFATSPMEGSVYVLQAPGLKPIAVLKLGKAPWGVFANPDCSEVYVTDILGRSVYVLDVDTLKVVAEYKTHMAYPHTVIFVDSATAKAIERFVKPNIEYNYTDLYPPVLACGDMAP
ncbi:hypothetical protein TUZN_1097 [Thermoproteus uzoniensis 768-20]|uniref:Uncharacterized protein n=1 Tax=Thermoproteus uzoniensis (strain 768-20) TaxID=999630 RepID=F2L095_THEU7|nr:hypothetical protein [Thermoproteus uzoniensis]AEA12577.1 hypothetical protein TUZN_1097 [Thermoproteus uzoniensis 768-20]